ncbi:hypothetical protein CC85DRAFT_184833 [Cutaneotrichosporon oleaginosum]|uniref:Uncharacterized protein n=1 Tax=Cutaneotrichosporon oleaginosum TaxID=879819 RepID=A0A0J0XEV3_9TREE|nr:uncharacterized protein CC85DRAFT_184833 [Cutaneotrichosporon oleaginosum]KLT39578.1 hypothetical protein CC85DRAFT_184833 [Cutaneotrichosporon oleaginosum]TXT15494.1 hypothetical protein COLE_01687 [Cutaneotrichosporon oleaginosum]
MWTHTPSYQDHRQHLELGNPTSMSNLATVWRKKEEITSQICAVRRESELRLQDHVVSSEFVYDSASPRFGRHVVPSHALLCAARALRENLVPLPDSSGRDGTPARHRRGKRREAPQHAPPATPCECLPPRLVRAPSRPARHLPCARPSNRPPRGLCPSRSSWTRTH